jgi:hypothetical protein
VSDVENKFNPVLLGNKIVQPLSDSVFCGICIEFATNEDVTKATIYAVAKKLWEFALRLEALQVDLGFGAKPEENFDSYAKSIVRKHHRLPSVEDFQVVAIYEHKFPGQENAMATHLANIILRNSKKSEVEQVAAGLSEMIKSTQNIDIVDFMKDAVSKTPSKKASASLRVA